MTNELTDKEIVVLHTAGRAMLMRLTDLLNKPNADLSGRPAADIQYDVVVLHGALNKLSQQLRATQT